MKTPREILLNRHRPAETKLDAVRKSALDAAFPSAARNVETRAPFPRRLVWVLWRELIFPCRRVWAGLAAAWVVLLVLNLPHDGRNSQVLAQITPPNREVQALLREQREMLTQFVEPSVPSPAVPSKTTVPRSEIPQTITLV